MRKKFTRFIIIATILLILLGLWYYRANIYSKEILKLEILGPTEAGLAEEVEYVVKYKNNGNVRLEEPKLIFEYPTASLIVEEEGQGQINFLRQEKSLDDIYPGEEKSFTFKARLLGKEGEVKIARVSVAYHPKNLRARYESKTTFTTTIKNSPLSFEFDIPSKADPGKEIPFRINYFSNLDYPLSNLRINVEYPNGFEF